MNCPYVMRRCSKCGEVKFLFKFVKHKGRKYGFRKECKECVSAYNKRYYEDNTEEVRKRSKQYREEHKEEIIEYKKQYYEDNKKEIAKKSKQYREEHKEELSEKSKQYYEGNKKEILKRQKKYYEESREEILEYHKQYYADNKKEIAEYHKQYNQTPRGQAVRFNGRNKRRNKKQAQGNGITTTQWIEMMNFFEWKCAYSDIYIGCKNQNIRSIDHIIALDNGGLNEIWNCIPMYRPYNSSKNTKDMLEWYQQQDFYSEERLQKIYEWQEYAYNKWNVNI